VFYHSIVLVLAVVLVLERGVNFEDEDDFSLPLM